MSLLYWHVWTRETKHSAYVDSTSQPHMYPVSTIKEYTHTHAFSWTLPILLMEEILHQLIGSFSHYLRSLYIPGGAGFLPSTVCPILLSNLWTFWEHYIEAYRWLTAKRLRHPAPQHFCLQKNDGQIVYVCVCAYPNMPNFSYKKVWLKTKKTTTYMGYRRTSWSYVEASAEKSSSRWNQGLISQQMLPTWRTLI